MLSRRAKGCTSRKIIGIPDIISIFSIPLRSRKVKAFPKTFTQGLRRISKILQSRTCRTRKRRSCEQNQYSQLFTYLYFICEKILLKMTIWKSQNPQDVHNILLQSKWEDHKKLTAVEKNSGILAHLWLLLWWIRYSLNKKITQENTVAALDAKNPCPPEKVAGEQGPSITSVSQPCWELRHHTCW